VKSANANVMMKTNIEGNVEAVMKKKKKTLM